LKKKRCEKNWQIKINFLTNKTYILCSFQKCNFHHWHKYIHAKKRCLKVFSLYAYHYHSHSHTHYQVNMPAPTCKLRQHASLLPRIKKSKPTDLYINLLSQLKTVEYQDRSYSETDISSYLIISYHQKLFMTMRGCLFR
jgi:hypothetical protein